jgi:PBSX family phage terminase large subunit
MKSALEHYYEPRGACKGIFENRSSELLISGPAGTGKSRACLEKLHLMALLNPGMRGLIVRKTATSLTSTALVTWRTHVIDEALLIGLVNYYGGSAQEPAQYRYTNGSVVIIGGMDKATRIMSSDYDIIYVQEAIELTENDWESLTTRLRNGKVSFQQLLADTNPDAPHHWLNVRQTSKTTMLESRHEDNPRLYSADGQMTPEGVSYISKLDNLTGMRYLRLRKGIWAAAEGLIYEDYDPATHLLDRFDIPDNWTRYWAIDFGFTNPFVCQWWAEDPDGRLYLYREIYRTRRTVDQHAKDILAQVINKDGWTEPKPRQIICDHDAEGRVVLQQNLGLATTPAKKQVIDGIQAVSKRLRKVDDGRPRLFICRDALVERDPELADSKRPTCTAEEIVSYIWDTGAGKQPKEQPLKQDDHGMDSMRYLVAQLDLVGQVRMRWL